MRQTLVPAKEPADAVVKEIRRATRRRFSAEDKMRIVLDGLKEFLEAGKKRLAGDTVREASSDEVKDLRRQAGALKGVVAELTLENRLLKKSMIGDGGDLE